MYKAIILSTMCDIRYKKNKHFFVLDMELFSFMLYIQPWSAIVSNIKFWPPKKRVNHPFENYDFTRIHSMTKSREAAFLTHNRTTGGTQFQWLTSIKFDYRTWFLSIQVLEWITIKFCLKDWQLSQKLFAIALFITLWFLAKLKNLPPIQGEGGRKKLVGLQQIAYRIEIDSFYTKKKTPQILSLTLQVLHATPHISGSVF